MIKTNITLYTVPHLSTLCQVFLTLFTHETEQHIVLLEEKRNERFADAFSSFLLPFAQWNQQHTLL